MGQIITTEADWKEWLATNGLHARQRCEHGHWVVTLIRTETGAVPGEGVSPDLMKARVAAMADFESSEARRG